MEKGEKIEGWQDKRKGNSEQSSSLPTFQLFNPLTLAWLALLIAAATMRLWNLGARTMSHDEALHTY